MRLVSLLICLCFSFSAVANTSSFISFEQAVSFKSLETKSSLKSEESKLFGKWKELMAKTELSAEETCVDEYQKRKLQVIFGAAAAPLIGAGGTYANMYLMLGLFTVLFPADPWAGLGGVILGLYSGVIGYVTYQTVKIVKAINMARLQRIVVESRLGEGRAVEYFAKRVLKRANLQRNRENIDRVISVISDLDSSNKLCDATLKSVKKQRRFERNGKLRNGVATKRELLKYLKNNL